MALVRRSWSGALASASRQEMMISTRKRLPQSWVRPRQRTAVFFFSSRRRHTRLQGDWSSDVCSSDLRVTRDGAPRTSGFLFYTREELAALLLAAWRAGRDVVCHAIGNLGLETAVGAIEDAVRAMPEGRARVRIDHAILLTAELIARIAALGIWVAAQPSLLWGARATSSATPPDPAILQRPFASVARAGVRQAFSSDYPCGSNAPLVGIAAAVTRTSRQGP